MEPIVMHDLRRDVDKRYVGFNPIGSSVKPVHIANGLFRVVYGQAFNTKSIAQISYVANAKGKTPKGNDLDTVWEKVNEADEVEASEVSKQDFQGLRLSLQKVLSVDEGVYGTDSMVAYSAGSKYFVTKDTLYQDAGEFIGGLISDKSPRLKEYIAGLLDEADDPISYLFDPLKGEAYENRFDQTYAHDAIDIFQTQNAAIEAMSTGMLSAGDSLVVHLQLHPNKLAQLRLCNNLGIYYIIWYLANLEAVYCGERIKPILLDFSNDSQSSIAKASGMCYTQIHRSISRFYAWAFAEELKRRLHSKDELLDLPTPKYEKNKTSKAGAEELKSIWDLAKEDAKKTNSDEDALRVFGMAIYDMIALEASSHPVNYLRALGKLSGILWPPTNFHSNKRFALSDDMVEMVIRSCVQPEEIIAMKDLKQRMWERFGLIVGGSSFDNEKLASSGSIIYADTDSLAHNLSCFEAKLESMGFADMMADGILRIGVGGSVS